MEIVWNLIGAGGRKKSDLIEKGLRQFAGNLSMASRERNQTSLRRDCDSLLLFLFRPLATERNQTSLRRDCDFSVNNLFHDVSSLKEIRPH